MKPVRLVVTILAVGAAGYLAFRGSRSAATTTPGLSATPAPAPVPDDPSVPPAPVVPFGQSAPAAAGQQAPAPQPPQPGPAVDVTLGGTPVKPDAEVSVVVPYRTGTKCRYRVVESELDKDRDSGAFGFGQWTWTVATEVLQGDGSGAARVRFQIESFRYETQAPDRRILVDSANPDRKLIDDPKYGLARPMKPLMAVCGMPVEFVIDAAGAIVDVEGVAAMNRKFLDVVAVFGEQQEQNAGDAPTVESMKEKWGPCLFPTLGGGTMKAGATRDTSFSKTFLDRWAMVAAGKLSVTHDDPVAFRVSFTGTPGSEELNRPAVHGPAVNVEKAKVVASADAYVASWRFDRAKGRLLTSRMEAKYTTVVAYRAGKDQNGVMQYEHPYTDVERRTSAEILDQ